MDDSRKRGGRGRSKLKDAGLTLVKSMLDEITASRGQVIGRPMRTLRLATEAEYPPFWWDLRRSAPPKLRLVRDDR